VVPYVSELDTAAKGSPSSGIFWIFFFFPLGQGRFNSKGSKEIALKGGDESDPFLSLLDTEG